MKKPTRIKVLQIITSVYGFLYLIFVLDNIINPTPVLDPWNKLDVGVYILFLIFLAGYIFMWRYPVITGWIFLLWCAGMYYLDAILCPTLPTSVSGGCGGGLIMGFPLLVLGILFLVFGYLKLKRKRTSGVL